MEMPGPWKAWKSKSSFSPLSTAPWESRQRREIPTFPQPVMPGMGKWKTKIRFPTFPRGACDDDRGLSVFRTKNQERRSARFAASSITFFRIHARLETELCFRIILRLENAVQHLRRFAEPEIAAPAPHIRCQFFHRRLHADACTACRGGSRLPIALVRRNKTGRP